MNSRGLSGDSIPRAPAPAPAGSREPTVRAILRVVATVVASVFALYLIFLLKTPIFWLFFATFIAVAVSAPVNVISRRMPRGAAIALVYLGLILVPIAIGAVLVPPAVRAATSLVSNFPSYVGDLDEVVQDSEQLRNLNENFNFTEELQQLAADAAGRLDDAAAALADVGAGLVGSLFAIFTILIMSIFIVSQGRQWVEAFLRTRPQGEAVATRRALDRMAVAVSSYVGGALLQATLAGATAFITLSILGVPSPLALAVVIAVLDLIPLVGATIGAILVGVVTLFVGFPAVTIIWVVYSIAYQQFENYVVQPRIQSRAVALDPFVIVVAAIFGGTLLGIVGALLSIPIAAAGQIAVKEFLAYRREGIAETGGGGGEGEDGEGREDADPGPGGTPLPA